MNFQSKIAIPVSLRFSDLIFGDNAMMNKAMATDAINAMKEAIVHGDLVKMSNGLEQIENALHGVVEVAEAGAASLEKFNAALDDMMQIKAGVLAEIAGLREENVQFKNKLIEFGKLIEKLTERTTKLETMQHQHQD